MTQRHSSDQESDWQEQAQQQADDVEHELVTVAMMDAAEGVGITDNRPEGVFFADGEEFLAFLGSGQDSD